MADSKKSARERVTAAMPYAKGGGWAAVAFALILQYQEATSAAGRAGTIADREAEVRAAARAMYTELTWKIAECRADVDDLRRVLADVRLDLNNHRHDRAGIVPPDYRGPAADPDEPISLGPVRVKRAAVERAAEALAKPAEVDAAEQRVRDFVKLE